MTRFIFALLLYAGPAWGWIAESNKLAESFTLDHAILDPQSGSFMGYRQFDDKVAPLDEQTEVRIRQFYEAWLKKLDAMIAAEKDPHLLLDQKILRDFVGRSLKGLQLAEKYGEIPFYAGTRAVLGRLRGLINDQSDAERKRSAVRLFKAMVHGQEAKPLLASYQAHTLFLEASRPAKLYPLKRELTRYLDETSSYLKGIKQLLSASGSQDWQADYKVFAKQAKAYDAFVKKHLLPKARLDFRLPPELYEFGLEDRGIDAKAEDLIKVARADFSEVYKEYRSLAADIAKIEKLSDASPVAVIKHLKTRQPIKPAELAGLYRTASLDLNGIIMTNDLVTLPKTPLKIRIAGEAESKAQPIPHLNPPPLVNNRGERPEFVVPMSEKGKLPLDDFSYPAATMALTAHEGRPGHDLQFSTMLDNGVSNIRASYAFNNVNVEGWGLYGEYLVYPYLSSEQKLAALQIRLLRIARMFLDPELQLGRITEDGARQVLRKEVGISETFSDLEIRRYVGDSGQAPSYYFGLKALLAAKQVVKDRLGAGFQERCFNDAVLALGLLPLKEIVDQLGALTCPIK